MIQGTPQFVFMLVLAINVFDNVSQTDGYSGFVIRYLRKFLGGKEKKAEMGRLHVRIDSVSPNRRINLHADLYSHGPSSQPKPVR